jgi:hypothetical protein
MSRLFPIQKREKSKRSAQSYNEIKKRRSCWIPGSKVFQICVSGHCHYATAIRGVLSQVFIHAPLRYDLHLLSTVNSEGER